MKNRIISAGIALTLTLSLFTSINSYATEATSPTQLAKSAIPATMAPETEIEYDSNNNMVITKKGIDSSGSYSVESSSTAENKINISSRINYSKEELKMMKEVIKLQKNNLKRVTEKNKLPESTPGLKVIYDGMGQPNKFYLNGMPYLPSEDGTTLKASATWTPPVNGTYNYGNCWIQIATTFNMGQGYLTYFTGTPGCHGDDLNKLDKTVDLCATKMQYDRPPRAKEIRVRKLDSNWNDTNTVVYVKKYDIGSLPNAVIDVRKPLMIRLTGPEGSSSFGRFNGRYHYSK